MLPFHGGNRFHGDCESGFCFEGFFRALHVFRNRLHLGGPDLQSSHGHSGDGNDALTGDDLETQDPKGALRGNLIIDFGFLTLRQGDVLDLQFRVDRIIFLACGKRKSNEKEHEE